MGPRSRRKAGCGQGLGCAAAASRLCSCTPQHTDVTRGKASSRAWPFPCQLRSQREQWPAGLPGLPREEDALSPAPLR